MSTLRVLVVEDSAPDTELMVRALRVAGFEPVYERVETADAMRQALAQQSWDVVLSDYTMPHFDAPAALAVLREHSADLPFIVVSGSVGEDTAVAVMKAGATDYVMKDRLQRLAPAVGRAVEDAAVRRERRGLEQQLLLSQKLEAVGRLAGGVAHDFNNVLTAILGSTELLLLDTPPGASHREELDIIRDAAVRAQELIRQLLAFSERQVLNPVVLDLNRLVKNVNKMLRRLIGEDIALVTTLAPDLGAVRADPGQIEQVLVNLAVNARDAMPQGGQLAIATQHVDIANGSVAGPVPPGRYVLLRVTDTGVGMDHETQLRVFDPFFTTKPRGKGSGLGLATVHGIVRQSGGAITVESAPGAGATFRIYLPRVTAPLDPVAASAVVTAPARGSETVLLAEDEELVRIMARKVLEQAGYRVLATAGGAEALTIAAGHDGPIHLLLTDVVMPEMSGRELMRRLIARRPEVRVLYMSGYADEAIAQHGVLDPGTAFMQKPFTPGALARRVREVLDG
jgi:two-component system cell cycle sensor histidine kinase/response regulator CckA